MNPLSLECLSVFGLHPVEFIGIAGELGCSFVTLNLSSAPNRLPIYPHISFRDDPALQREIAQAARNAGVGIGMMEGFAILPDDPGETHERDLDMVAEMGARAICVVSLERNLGRTLDEFARFAEMAAARGMVVTTEVGTGVMARFAKAKAAVEAVASPSFKLLIDTMHFFRLGATVADLATLDPMMIGHIQLCDVPMPAVIENYMEEALFERRAPGDGDLPLVEFLRVIPREVIVGLEVPVRSEAQVGQGPRMRLGKCVTSTRTLLDKLS